MKKPGGQRVDADASLGKVNGEPLGEIADRRLSPAIGRDLGQRAEGVHRRHVDHRTTFSPDHLAGKNLGRHQRAEKVQVKDEADAFRIEIEEGAQ